MHFFSSESVSFVAGSTRSPIPVVDDRVDDGVHLLGEFGRVGAVLVGRRAAAFLLLAPGGAAVLSARRRRLLVRTPLAFALLQPDLLLHLFQVPILNGLEWREGEREREDGT